MFNFIRDSQLCSRGCTILSHHWQCVWDPVAPPSHQYLALSQFFFLIGHSHQYIVAFHSFLKLYLPNDYWCLTDFHVPVCYLCIYFGEVSVQGADSFVRFFNMPNRPYVYPSLVPRADIFVEVSNGGLLSMSRTRTAIFLDLPREELTLGGFTMFQTLSLVLYMF